MTFMWFVAGASTVVLFVMADIGYDFIDVYVERMLKGILRTHEDMFGVRINITIDVSILY